MKYTKEEPIEINVNKAPTDDSIRIYGEMREKAYADILASGKEAFGVSGTRWVATRRLDPWGIEISFAVEVNGREHEGHCFVGQMDLANTQGPFEACDKIEKAMREAVTRLVVDKLLEDGFRNVGGEVSRALDRVYK
jgi:hypothetical protein